MKKLSKLLGLTEEAPKPGHWMESLRNAGTTNVPATTGDVNEDALSRMMNTPMDRRGFMEKTGQAAQAASMAGRLGGALGDLLPQGAPAELTGILPDFAEKLPSALFSVIRNRGDEIDPGKFYDGLISHLGRSPTKEEDDALRRLSTEYQDSLTGLADFGSSPHESPAYLLDYHRGNDLYIPGNRELHDALSSGLTDFKFGAGDKEDELLNRVLDAAASAWDDKLEAPELGRYEGLYDRLIEEVYDSATSPASKEAIKEWVSELRQVYGPDLNQLMRDGMNNPQLSEESQKVLERGDRTQQGQFKALLGSMREIAGTRAEERRGGRKVKNLLDEYDEEDDFE